MARPIGILGGTFDPVHNAHLAIASAALRALDPEKIIWMPTGVPAYRAAPVAAAADRLAMLKRALADEPRYTIDERELEPGASGYTFDTLSSLRKVSPQSNFILIIGADQYAKREDWHRWTDIEKLCDIAVFARPGWNVDAKAKSIPMTPLSISASDIRTRIGRGEDVSGMLPAAVLRYIGSHHLYGHP